MTRHSSVLGVCNGTSVCLKALQVCTYVSLVDFTDLINEALKLDQKILELARELYQQKSLIVMGRGFNFATCLEGALV